MQLSTIENRISTSAIYKLFGYNEHRNIKGIILKHKDVFNELAELRISTGSTGDKGGRPCESYMLTLSHALLLSGLVKNSSSSRKTDVLISIIKAYEESSLVSALDMILNMDFDGEKEDRYIYVAKEVASGRFKIGISKNPEERVKHLNIGNPEKLVIVHAYLATEDGYKSEALAHKIYEKNRLNGEWFDSSIDISLLPSYKVICTADNGDSNCDCKGCSDYNIAFDALSDKEPSSRDLFIDDLISNHGFEFKVAAECVDSLFDTGVIQFA